VCCADDVGKCTEGRSAAAAMPALTSSSCRGSNCQEGLRIRIEFSCYAFCVARNPIEAWLPSQNGLFFDAPQRQTVMLLRTSY